MWIYVIAAFELAGVVSAVHAVMATRTSQGAVAWAVSLITFPFLAVPLYWVFGRDKFQGYVLARQGQLQQLHEAMSDATAGVREAARAANANLGALRSAEQLARMPVTSNNAAELLVDGDATFESIFSGIDSAEDYVLVQFYIVRNDGLGRALKDRLVAKAKNGVRVFLVYDEIGSLGLPESYLRELREAGAQAHPFDTRKGWWNRFQLNFRNHRKIVVVDGKVCWIGGHNVGDEYLGKDPKFGKWRDTHLRIEGPAVIAAQLSFTEDWHWASGSLIEDLDWSAHILANGSTSFLIAPSGPADALETAALLHTQVINGANQRLWIASPYFVPDEGIIAALQLACLRGVDVRIIIPDKTDNTAVSLATYTYFDELHDCGAEFYRHTEGFMHQKVLLVDDKIAAVGTANFDNRSFRLNFEVTAVGVGPDYFAAVESMLENDLAHSTQMPGDAYTSKPLWFRVAARVCRLGAPVL